MRKQNNFFLEKILLEKQMKKIKKIFFDLSDIAERLDNLNNDSQKENIERLVLSLIVDNRTADAIKITENNCSKKFRKELLSFIYARNDEKLLKKMEKRLDVRLSGKEKKAISRRETYEDFYL